MNAEDYFKITQMNEFIRKLDDRLYMLEKYIYLLDEKIVSLNRAYENISIKVNEIDIGKAIARAIKWHPTLLLDYF